MRELHLHLHARQSRPRSLVLGRVVLVENYAAKRVPAVRVLALQRHGNLLKLFLHFLLLERVRGYASPRGGKDKEKKIPLSSRSRESRRLSPKPCGRSLPAAQRTPFPADAF